MIDPNKAAAEYLKVAQVRYVTGIPRKALAEGRVLVHNHIVPAMPIGMNGFRAWTQVLDNDRLVVCTCDFAGADLGGLTHYRVHLKGK